MTALTLALLAALAAGQARPVTLISEVKAAIAAHDLSRAEALVAARRAEQGDTPEAIEAVSWLGRGALAEKQADRAERHELSVDRGARSDAIAFLERELKAYAGTSIHKRLQKNVNLLTLEGHPAPALELAESIGMRPPTFAELKGKVVVLFFWAHWCSDCKAEGPILAKLLAKYQSRGMTVVAPTQRFGYVAGGVAAPPDEELRYIVKVRDQYYPFLASVPVPVSVANHERYGVSSTPTVVILDRGGIVRLYHPGQLTEEELEARLQPLLAAPLSSELR